MKLFKLSILTIFFVSSLFLSLEQNSSSYRLGIHKAHAAHSCCNICVRCASLIRNCSETCVCQSDAETPITIQHITDEFIEHRRWLIEAVWEAYVLPSMMLMTEQITTAAMKQVFIIGTLLDAKNQLETQRLLQELDADIHAKYHPGIQGCQFTTLTRSLARAEREKEVNEYAIAQRFIQRQALNGDTVSAGGPQNDIRSRWEQYQSDFCTPADLGNGLTTSCNNGNANRVNNDVNFTELAMKNNLNINFVNAPASADEADIMALQSNLYGHKIFPQIPQNRLADENGGVKVKGMEVYLKMRAVMAKRSVAQAAFASFVAARTESGEAVQPYMDGMLREMGISEEARIARFGEFPSHHTQMYFLTNTMFQDPTFYSELYDKPENVDRTKVAIQAINLKLEHDKYESVLRTNAIQSVLLEAYLDEAEDRFINEAKPGQQIQGQEVIDIGL
ncbi:MAG: hypothetical protein AAF549_02740 [Pseudomonadota bacterium]